jgi:hypothetical protein
MSLPLKRVLLERFAKNSRLARFWVGAAMVSDEALFDVRVYGHGSGS